MDYGSNEIHPGKDNQTVKILFLKNVAEGEDNVSDPPTPNKLGDSVDPVTEFHDGAIETIEDEVGGEWPWKIYLSNGFYFGLTRGEMEKIAKAVYGEAVNYVELTQEMIERRSRIVAKQVRYQQRKLVRRALEASGIPVHQEAARRAEAMRLLKMPLGELQRMMNGEDPYLVVNLLH